MADAKDTADVPRSFRLSDEADAAINEGARRFGMSKTKWLEWLATSAIADQKKFISNDNFEITILSKER